MPASLRTAKAKTQKKKDSKMAEDVDILGMTRAQVFGKALSLHGEQDNFAVGPVSGPVMKLTWSGSPYVSRHDTAF